MKDLTYARSSWSPVCPVSKMNYLKKLSFCIFSSFIYQSTCVPSSAHVIFSNETYAAISSRISPGITAFLYFPLQPWSSQLLTVFICLLCFPSVSSTRVQVPGGKVSLFVSYIVNPPGPRIGPHIPRVIAKICEVVKIFCKGLPLRFIILKLVITIMPHELTYDKFTWE